MATTVIYRRKARSFVFIHVETHSHSVRRQCMCCYRDIKNFERFNLIVQSMIYLAVLQLKNIQALVDALKPPNPTSNNNNNDSNTTTDTNDPVVDKKEDSDSKTDSNWTLKEVEQLLILISKAFLLNFPLYIAYKHGVHSRLDDISAQEAQVISEPHNPYRN